MKRKCERDLIFQRCLDYLQKTQGTELALEHSHTHTHTSRSQFSWGKKLNKILMWSSCTGKEGTKKTIAHKESSEVRDFSSNWDKFWNNTLDIMLVDFISILTENRIFLIWVSDDLEFSIETEWSMKKRVDNPDNYEKKEMQKEGKYNVTQKIPSSWYNREREPCFTSGRIYKERKTQELDLLYERKIYI